MERHSLVISSIDPAVRQLDVRIRIVRILGLRRAASCCKHLIVFLVPDSRVVGFDFCLRRMTTDMYKAKAASSHPPPPPTLSLPSPPPAFALRASARQALDLTSNL